MKRLWIILLALLLVACDDGVYSGTLIFDGAHHFDGQTRLPGDVLLRAGTAEFAAGSQVAGTVYVIGGALVTDGAIGGDLVMLDGRITLGPNADVDGDLRLGGAGSIVAAETAVIRGDTVTGLSLPELTQDNSAWDDRLRGLVGALLLAALGGVWARRRPRPLRNVSDAATTHWPVAVALGLLALLVLPVLLVMMALTIVLLPLVVVLALGIFLVLGMGVISLGERLGGRLWAWRERPSRPGPATFTGTLLLMGLFALPWVGGVLFIGTAVLLFGAVLLSRFGTRDYEPPPSVTLTEDLSVYERPFVP